MNDKISLKGSISLEVRGPDGKLKQVLRKDNLVVTAGKNFLAAWLAAATQANAFMPYTAVGTGTNAPTSGDTTLQTEVVRQANTASASTNILSLNHTFGPGSATGAITEAGLFSAASVGTMFSRVTFSVVNVAAGDSLVVNWSVTFS